MIELSNINRIYKSKGKTVHALNDISLTLRSGQFTAILGLTGSGKTTLLSILGGMDRQSSGQFIFCGQDTNDFSSHAWSSYRQSSVGFVFQEFFLIEHLTAEENILLSMSLSDLSDDEKKKRCYELLEEVEMTDFSHHLPNELSGGQQQRIAIARALANNPKVLLADEPTGALDPKISRQILNLLKKLASKGHMVIMVTHNHILAEQYADRVIELEAGCVIRDNNPQDKDVFGREILKKKKHLNLKSTVKIAWNNLRLRKKSSILIMVALIPCMIITMFLSNFFWNLKMIREDIEPVYESIVGNEDVLYFSSISDYEFEKWVEKAINELNQKSFNEERIQRAEDVLFTPLNDESRKKILAIDEIDGIYEPVYMDVKIGSDIYLLVSLPPIKYKFLNKNITSYYPSESDQGIIVSQELSQKLSLNEKDDLLLSLIAINGASLHGKSLLYKNDINTNILKVVDYSHKTEFMKNYHNGVIYAPYEYVWDLRSSYTVDDISIASFDVHTPSKETGYKLLGGKSLTDLNRFLKEPNIFGIYSHAISTPNNAFGLKQTLILNKDLSQESIKTLEEIGYISDSPYSELTVDAAKKMNRTVALYLRSTLILIGVVIFIPLIILGIILFISILLRKEEIGVMKAIGIGRLDIIKVFIVESLIIGFSSSLLAIIFAIPSMVLSKSIFYEKLNTEALIGANPFQMELQVIGISMIAILILVTITGTIPGIKASSLEAKMLLNTID